MHFLSVGATISIIMLVQLNHITRAFTSKTNIHSKFFTSKIKSGHGTYLTTGGVGQSSSFHCLHSKGSISFCAFSSSQSSSPLSPFSKKIARMNNSARTSASTNTNTRLFTSTINSERDSKTKEEEIQMVQDMLYRIRECNTVPQNVKAKLMDFAVLGETLGKVTEQVAKLLCHSSPSGKDPVFKIDVDANSSEKRNILTLTEEAGDTVEKRTDAVMSVMEYLRDKGVIKGWRDELLPLSGGFYDEPVVLVERAAAPFLGMQQYGVHIVGTVREDDGELKMWVARRSKTKSKYPGMLDHIVAGGQPAGIGLLENVVKECGEEAGISEETTLAGIQPAGAVSYEQFEPSDCEEYDGVVTRSLLFNYDLDLPRDFTPKVVDGEVEEFFLWTIDEVMESMRREYDDPIKPNCYLVIIDFLLRRGYLSPEVPGYLDILRELRGGHCG